MKNEFGIIGLGVMGKSLARNFAKNGCRLSLFNRHVAGMEENVANALIHEFPELKDCQGFDDLESFVNSLEVPRKILIMVNAGKAIDVVIEQLSTHLQSEDILIDGGNSYYKNTDSRNKLLSNRGIQYIGMGVSGGEEGALNGPSLMSGGNFQAYRQIEHYLNKIAAKDLNGTPCSQFIGKDGAGHFVKMVHNGIEYGEMQLIAEIYLILRYHNDLDPDEISTIFKTWNGSSLRSYLLDSTAKILRKKDGDEFLIDLILDKASHKGTGSWTTITAAELGIPFSMASSALNARYISAFKEMRSDLSTIYKLKQKRMRDIGIEQLKNSYQIARIVNHHQGFQLIGQASMTYNWNIDLKKVAMVWTSGCIIASQLMETIVGILDQNETILENNNISGQINSQHEHLKSVVVQAIEINSPIPCLTESLNYLNAITRAMGTGNIIQAQRDFFGSHTYKRIDDPQGLSHHTNWKND
jgi:6-phosphogluconate dehydrogenase